MKEKELRIALVCFGGVSLAIYMYGICREILKLVRASGTLHSIANRSRRSTAAFFDVRDRNDPEFDTEAVYFELLRNIGRTVELRVIVDIIAGTSAGGINGTMLARALSHDLPMGRLRDLWLQNADVTELLAAEARATRWSKWFLRPFFWTPGRFRLAAIQDREMRTKLSMFVRSRWFKPPLDGMRMAGMMFDAVTAMGSPRDAGASLLPSGLGLDLFVTLTNFYGSQQLMQIHDPPIIHEREHRHIVHFRYRRLASGDVESDFDLDNAPALAFAARATSSFPGAFPPARIVEIDELVKARAVAWPRREEFIRRNFGSYVHSNIDVASESFIDGSVLNNRPFREAIMAIRGRPAYREVDRRLIYIDPDPAPPGEPAQHDVPGFFTTLKWAASDLPRVGPITSELNWIANFNERARRLSSIVESARPRVSRLVTDMIAADLARPIDAEQIRLWREQANVEAARDAGFAYEGYVRLKLTSVHSFVSQLIADIRGVRRASPMARAIAEIIDAWTAQTGERYEPAESPALGAETAASGEPVPQWVRFLLAFDVDYRERRLRFLIEGQNRLYQMLATPQLAGLDTEAVDGLKRKLYQCLDALALRKAASATNPTTRNLVEEIFQIAPSPAEIKKIGRYARSFVERHGGKISKLIGLLARDIALENSTRELDLLLAVSCEGWQPEARREVLINYLGFSFWDVLTFPVMTWRETGEFNEILVDRISPSDASFIEGLGAPSLMGTRFDHFAGFFARAYRENDYLLGRLHALDRLIDIVCDAAGLDSKRDPQVLALKKRGVLGILDAEEPHLPKSGAMIAELRRLVAPFGAD